MLTHMLSSLEKIVSPQEFELFLKNMDKSVDNSLNH